MTLRNLMVKLLDGVTYAAAGGFVASILVTFLALVALLFLTCTAASAQVTTSVQVGPKGYGRAQVGNPSPVDTMAVTVSLHYETTRKNGAVTYGDPLPGALVTPPSFTLAPGGRQVVRLYVGDVEPGTYRLVTNLVPVAAQRAREDDQTDSIVTKLFLAYRWVTKVEVSQ